MSKKQRKKNESSGVRKSRAGKNVARDGRVLHLDKWARRSLDPLYCSELQLAQYFEFQEKDRKDRKGRLQRLERSVRMDAENAKKNRPDVMKTPLLEVVLKDLKSAQILQALFTASCLKFIVKSGWPFFYVKRLHKMSRPISLEGVVI